MKFKIKNLILFVGIIIMFISCGVLKKRQEKNDYPFGTSMVVTCNIQNGKDYQIDSIVKADTLPNIEGWLRSVYIDFDTEERIIKRLYIKTHKDGTESVYVVMGSKEPYKITKRITK